MTSKDRDIALQAWLLKALEDIADSEKRTAERWRWMQEQTTEEEEDDPLEDANGYSRSDLLFGGNWS
jgi:hypothetical protein